MTSSDLVDELLRVLNNSPKNGMSPSPGIAAVSVVTLVFHQAAEDGDVAALDAHQRLDLTGTDFGTWF